MIRQTNLGGKMKKIVDLIIREPWGLLGLIALILNKFGFEIIERIQNYEDI